MKSTAIISTKLMGGVSYDDENDSGKLKRVTLLFLGSTGAGPVYSLEMAKALSATGRCHLQCVISKQISNLLEWQKEFDESNVQLDIVDTYKHNKLSFAISLIEFWKINRIVDVIKRFQADSLYVPFLLTWDFLIYPRLYKEMQIIATLHDPHPHDVSRNPFSKWILLQNKKAYQYVNDVVVLNNSDVEYVKDNFCPNVHVVPHASFSYYVRERNDDFEIKQTIGFIGRIEPYKGLDLLVDAFLQLEKEYRLIIAGSGKIEDNTYEKIKSNDRIVLINRYINDDEFTGLISKMDFVVLPYKRASQSGVIPLVFAHRKPVIATNVGALKEQVPEGTGIICDTSSTSIVQAIHKLYSNPELINEYGSKAKIYAESELTWERSADKILNIVEQ